MTHEQEKQSDDTLTALLKEFGNTVAHESRLSGHNRERLIDTILEAAEDVPSVRKPQAFGRIRRALTLLASSVVLMLTLGYWWQLSNENGVTVPIEKNFAEKYRDLMQIALEHEAIMQHPLAWFAEWNNDVQFTLLPENTTSSSRVVFAELRIERLHKEPKTYFLMIRDTQPLELFGRGDSSPELLLWLYPVEENLFAYELSVDGKTVDTSGLIEPETTVHVEDHAEYRLFLQIHST